MIIGVPKEIKLQEHRIGLTPESVKALTDKNHEVLVENNGGFASIRRGFDGNQLKEASKFLLRVKGDGSIYKFRLTMKGSYANYSADFKTTKDQWMNIEIPVENFKPYYFGRSIRAPKLKVRKVNSMGILISNKQEGDFSLEIEYIKAF